MSVGMFLQTRPLWSSTFARHKMRKANVLVIVGAEKVKVRSGEAKNGRAGNPGTWLAVRDQITLGPTKALQLWIVCRGVSAFRSR